MTSDQETALTVYLDPNYDPTFSYSHLEGWLLLYDKIYISSPSPYQVKRAHRELDVPLVSERSLQDFVRQGWIVPVGRSRFFTEEWRSSRAGELEKIDAVRAAHFSWSGEFDAIMAAHAQRLPDNELDEAIETGTALDKRYPDAFAEVLRRVNLLRAEGLLPAKFKSPSEIVKDSTEIAKGVLYEVAGDLWVRRHLGTTGMIVPSEHESIYALLDRADDGWSPLEPQIGSAIRRTKKDLSEQDLLLAQELAERIVHDFTISDVLAEYRESALQHQFRAFVLKAMEDLKSKEEAPATPQVYGLAFSSRLTLSRKPRISEGSSPDSDPPRSVSTLMCRSCSNKDLLVGQY